MRFNPLPLFMCCFLTNCSAGSGIATAVAPQGQIGDELSADAPAYTSGLMDREAVSITDPFVGRMHTFSLSPLGLSRSLPLTQQKEESVALLAGHSGEYVVALGKHDVAIHRAAGDTETLPGSFAGVLKTAAFDPQENAFVLVDDLRTMGVLLLTDQGEISALWGGGPLLDREHTINGGTILSGKRLAVSLGDKDFAVVDLNASTEQREWVFEAFSLEIERGLVWIARVPDHDDLALGDNGREVVLIDLKAKTIVDRLSLNAKRVLTRGRDIQPHLLIGAFDQGDGTFGTLEMIAVSPDGKLVQREMDNAPVGTRHSIYDPDMDTLIMVVRKDESNDERFHPHEIYRFRIKDNLALSRQVFETSVRVSVTPDFLFVQHNSPLGYVESFDWESQTSRTVKLFNKPFLRESR